MNARAQKIMLLVDGVSKQLRKSILTAKTTFIAHLTVLGPCACAVRQVLQAAAVPH